jgi:hypothetical protein
VVGHDDLPARRRGARGTTGLAYHRGRRVRVVPDAVVARCASRAEADLLVAILTDAGVPAVAFVDVERSPEGMVFRESADVRVRADDTRRAQSALEEWRNAREDGIAEDELERQALEAGGAADAVADARDGAGRDLRDPTDAAVAAPPPRATRCPYCAAAVAVPWSGRLRRVLAVLAVLVGRPASGGPECVCRACGHRFVPGA